MESLITEIERRHLEQFIPLGDIQTIRSIVQLSRQSDSERERLDLLENVKEASQHLAARSALDELMRLVPFTTIHSVITERKRMLANQQRSAEFANFMLEIRRSR